MQDEDLVPPNPLAGIIYYLIGTGFFAVPFVLDKLTISCPKELIVILIFVGLIFWFLGWLEF